MTGNKIITVITVLIFMFGTTNAQTDAINELETFKSSWDELLKKYVTDDGRVDYKGFVSEKQIVEKCIGILKSNSPDESWTDNEKMAYWINSYNVFTIWLITEHYPLKSIMKIKEKGCKLHMKLFLFQDHRLGKNIVNHLYSRGMQAN